jgi:hypothetical protein
MPVTGGAGQLGCGNRQSGLPHAVNRQSPMGFWSLHICLVSIFGPGKGPRSLASLASFLWARPGPRAADNFYLTPRAAAAAACQRRCGRGFRGFAVFGRCVPRQGRGLVWAPGRGTCPELLAVPGLPAHPPVVPSYHCLCGRHACWFTK